MKIEPGIPIPKMLRGGQPGIPAKTASAMKAGDSVLCDSLTEYESLRSAIKRRGWKASCRKCRNGWRVWRTE